MMIFISFVARSPALLRLLLHHHLCLLLGPHGQRHALTDSTALGSVCNSLAAGCSDRSDFGPAQVLGVPGHLFSLILRKGRLLVLGGLVALVGHDLAVLGWVDHRWSVCVRNDNAASSVRVKGRVLLCLQHVSITLHMLARSLGNSCIQQIAALQILWRVQRDAWVRSSLNHLSAAVVVLVDLLLNLLNLLGFLLLVRKFIEESHFFVWLVLLVLVLRGRHSLLGLNRLRLNGQHGPVVHHLSVIELWVGHACLSLCSLQVMVLLEALIRVLEYLIIVVHIQPLGLRQVDVLRILLTLAAHSAASLGRRSPVVLSCADLASLVTKEIRVLLVFLSLTGAGPWSVLRSLRLDHAVLECLNLGLVQNLGPVGIDNLLALHAQLGLYLVLSLVLCRVTSVLSHSLHGWIHNRSLVDLFGPDDGRLA